VIAPNDVLPQLEGARQCGRGWIAKCPAHRDRRPSLKVDTGVDGRALLHCFAGCSYPDIIRALRLERLPSGSHSIREPNVHALALCIARAQRWADPFARDVMSISKHVRECFRAADALRRRATLAGPTPAAWDDLVRAARLECEALRVEHASDEALR
jgi:hypothetical protein